MIKIWTDGACSGNPGPGGWGTITEFVGLDRELAGFEEITTNNRMELKGPIEALKRLPLGLEDEPITITCDSQYVTKGFTDGRLKKWKAAGWRNTAGPVKNLDLWKELDMLTAGRDITWVHVKGHSGDEHNERCDQLATEQIRKYNK